MPQFNALSGPELKKFLLAKIEEALDKTDKFGNHLSHPWVKYEFKLGLTLYPQQSQEDEPKNIVVLMGIEDVDPGSGEPEPKENEVVLDLSEKAIIDTPDKARVESSQPIPTTTKGPGDILIDKPMMKLPERKGK